MKNLLVPIDFSDVTERVVAAAQEVAQACHAKVWLMHCVDQFPSIAAMSDVPMVMPVPQSELPERFPAIYRQLTALTTEMKNNGVEAESLFMSGSVVHAILAAADHYQIDMMVIGSHGHGAFYELVVGTVTDAVLHYSSRPTLVVPSDLTEKKKPEITNQREIPLATPY